MNDAPSPPVPSRPRVAPSLLVAFGTLPAMVLVSLVSMVVLVAAAVATGQADGQAGAEAWIEELVASAPGLIALTIPVQLFLIATALGAALLSPTAWRERLALRPPGLGPGSWGLVVVGTLGVLVVMQLLGEHLIEEPSEQLKLLARVLTESEGALAVVIAVLFSALPGFSEELVFRGFVLTGLARRWPAWASIGTAAFAFAILHMDPQHAALVFPLGLWFGFVAWATRSVVTAMVCHALNNFTAIVLGQAFGDAKWSELAPGPAVYGAAALLVLGTAACAVHLVRRRQSVELA